MRCFNQRNLSVGAALVVGLLNYSLGRAMPQHFVPIIDQPPSITLDTVAGFPSYEEAVADTSLQANWLRKFVTPSYTRIKIASSLGDSATREDHDNNESPIMRTVTLNFDKKGRFAESEILVYDKAFNLEDYSVEEARIFIEEVTIPHELLHAFHVFYGIPGYHPAEFERRGFFDTRLFDLVSESFAYSQDLQRLEQIDRQRFPSVEKIRVSASMGLLVSFGDLEDHIDKFYHGNLDLADRVANDIREAR